MATGTRLPDGSRYWVFGAPSARHARVFHSSGSKVWVVTLQESRKVIRKETTTNFRDARNTAYKWTYKR